MTLANMHMRPMDGAYSGVSSTATSECSSRSPSEAFHQAKDSKPVSRPAAHKPHSLGRSAGSALSAQHLVLDRVFILQRCAAEAVLLPRPALCSAVVLRPGGVLSWGWCCFTRVHIRYICLDVARPVLQGTDMQINLNGTECPHGSGHAGAGAMTDTTAVPAIAQPTEATSAPGAEAPPSSAAEPPKR